MEDLQRKNPDHLICFKPKDVRVEAKNNSGKYDINSEWR